MKSKLLYFILSAIILSQSQMLFSQELITIEHLRGEDRNYVRGFDIGSSGKTVVCGDYWQNLTVGVGDNEATVSTTGVTSGYIASYDEHTNLQFLLGLKSSKYGNVQDVYVDDNNAIYASGDYAGVMNLDPLGDGVEITSTGFSEFVNSEDPFLAKYDETGKLVWFLNPVESNYGYGSAIIPTPTGSIIWAGTYSGYMKFQFEGATVTYSDPPFENGDDSFIFEVDSVGQISRHLRTTGSGTLYFDEGCYDAAGNLYLTGFVQGDVVIEAADADYTINTESANQKFFILQIKPDWSIGWHIISDGESAYGRGVTINSDGDLVFAGYYSGLETFSSLDGENNVTLTSVGERDIFMGKYSTDGALLEAHSIGGIYDEFLYSMFLDEEDQLYLSGSFDYEMDVDPSENTNLITSGLGTSALLVLKYTASFNYGWSYFTGSGVNFGEDAVGMGIVGEDIMVAGNFSSKVNFNPKGEEEVILQGSMDGYLVKLTNPDITTSITEFTEKSFSVFPNPTQGQLRISLNAPIAIDQIRIYDFMGKSVYAKKVSYATAAYHIELPKLSSGIYILSLEGKENLSQKFIISE